MKKLILLLVFALSGFVSKAQNNNVGIGTTNPEATAILDLTSTDKGLLIPRVSLIDVNNTTSPINNPATGLLVWNTNATVTGGSGAGFYFYNGSKWDILNLGDISTLADADNDTKIQVEESADEDIIRFDMAGTEQFKMTGKRFETINSGRSVIIGEGAGLNDNASIKENTFIGFEAASTNTSGAQNVAIGNLALEDNSTGSGNTALGSQALDNNTTGTSNTALGYKANVTTGNLTNATAIGYQSRVATSNSLVLGGLAPYNVNVGIGTSSPTELLTLSGISGTDGILFPDNTLQTTAYTGSAAASELTDADNNTKIQVEESADDNIIRFDMEGTEFFRMDSGRLEVINTGNSVFIGDGAGANDDFSDNRNVAVGDSALYTNINGYDNTASGNQSLYSNTSGAGNTANGSLSLISNTTGSHNTANGTVALHENTTGNGNTANGLATLYDNTTGNSNTATGQSSLRLTTTGNFNTATGYEALKINTTGDKNTAIGYQADVASNNLTNATAIGANAIVSQDSSLVLGNAAKVGIGTSSPDAKLHVVGDVKFVDGNEAAGKVLTSDADGLASWQTSLAGDPTIIQDTDNNTKIQVEESADDNIIRFDMEGTEFFRMDSGRLEVINTGRSVFIGEGAGANDDFSDNKNVAVGDSALYTNIIGDKNTAIGNQSLYSNTFGEANTANGSRSLFSNTTGGNNTANGVRSLFNNTEGNYNTASGKVTLFYNTTGSNNAASGFLSLYYNTTGDANTANGNYSLLFNTTGENNTANGFRSLQSNTTGNLNTGIGYQADVAYDSLTNATAIGANAKVSQDSSLVLGNAAKVGIGTSSPDAKLHVVGDVKFVDGNEAAGKVLTSDADGLASWQTLPAADTLTILSDADNDTKIQVEESADEDIIRFDMAGTEFFRMDSGRLEVVNTGQSVFIGNLAGNSDDFSNNRNVFIGEEAGKSNILGSKNIAIGYSALSTNVDSSYNNAIGYEALKYNRGSRNNAFGYNALLNNVTGEKNTAIGDNAIVRNSGGSENTAIGVDAGFYNVHGTRNVTIGNGAGKGLGPHNKSNNVMIGYEAGGESHSQGNVLIGYQAGKTGASTSGGDKLYIENSSSTSPLIYGEFDNDLLRINGTLNINSAFSFPTTDGTVNQVLKTDGSGNLTWTNDIGTGAIVNTTVTNSEVTGQNASIDIKGKLEVTGEVQTFGNVKLGGAGDPTPPTITIGSSGSALTSIIKVDVTKNVGSISSDSQLNVDFNVPGAVTGSSVIVSPSADLPNQVFIGQARVQSSGVVRVRFHNESNSSKDPASMTYYITVIK